LIKQLSVYSDNSYTSGGCFVTYSRTDISPKFDKLTNGRTVYHTWLHLITTPRLINEIGPLESKL